MLFEVKGRVIRGDNYGKRLGFPTANIDRRQLVSRSLKIKQGIYAGTVVLPSGRSYRAGIVIGPLDKKKLPKLEANLIGFKGNLYGKALTFRLYKFLRPFQNYKSESLLKQQISKDIKIIKQAHFNE